MREENSLIFFLGLRRFYHLFILMFVFNLDGVCVCACVCFVVFNFVNLFDFRFYILASADLG